MTFYKMPPLSLMRRIIGRMDVGKKSQPTIHCRYNVLNAHWD